MLQFFKSDSFAHYLIACAITTLGYFFVSASFSGGWELETFLLWMPVVWVIVTVLWIIFAIIAGEKDDTMGVGS